MKARFRHDGGGVVPVGGFRDRDVGRRAKGPPTGGVGEFGRPGEEHLGSGLSWGVGLRPGVPGWTRVAKRVLRVDLDDPRDRYVRSSPGTMNGARSRAKNSRFRQGTKKWFCFTRTPGNATNSQGPRSRGRSGPRGSYRDLTGHLHARGDHVTGPDTLTFSRTSTAASSTMTLRATAGMHLEAGRDGRTGAGLVVTGVALGCCRFASTESGDPMQFATRFVL